MRRLRKTIALYLILTLTVCALTSLPVYAGDPQGKTDSGQTQKSNAPEQDLWELLCELLGL